MEGTLEAVLASFEVQPDGQDCFRGTSRKDTHGRVYGGLLLAQALAAAFATVQERRACSLHAYFINPASSAAPVTYQVSRVRDGGSFSTRLIAATQGDRPVTTVMASFQVPEPGPEYQHAMPNVAGPETAVPEEEQRILADGRPMPGGRLKWLGRTKPFEIRHLDIKDPITRETREPVWHMWLRAAGKVPEDDALRQCLLVYVSDFYMLDPCILPHDLQWHDKGLQWASLEHSVWFHHPATFDDWMLFAQDCPVTSQARGSNREMIYSRDGTLLASVVQEGLIRQRNSNA